MAVANKLTVERIEALTKPNVYADGNTLYLRVRRGSKQWLQIINVNGKRTERGLGGYPAVSLEEARNKAWENRRVVKRGGNPWASNAKKTTFAVALEEVIELQRDGWRSPKSEAQWRSSMEAYALPLLGGMDVADIRTPNVLSVLEPIWHDKRETANRVKQRIHAVMLWAIAKGHRTDNPVDAVAAVLPRRKPAVVHHAALPWQEVPAALCAINNTKAHIGTKLSFAFLVLTAARSNEVRNATWQEVDLDGALWKIPATKMKAGNEHAVPLSAAAMDVLERAKAMDANKKNLLFPSLRGKVAGDQTISKLLRENGVAAVPHGFRSSFRDWAAENDYDRDIAEAALAHTVRNAVEAAYRRTSFLDKRRAMMEDWGEFCAVGMNNAPVVEVDGVDDVDGGNPFIVRAKR